MNETKTVQTVFTLAVSFGLFALGYSCGQSSALDTSNPLDAVMLGHAVAAPETLWMPHNAVVVDTVAGRQWLTTLDVPSPDVTDAVNQTTPRRVLKRSLSIIDAAGIQTEILMTQIINLCDAGLIDCTQTNLGNAKANAVNALHPTSSWSNFQARASAAIAFLRRALEQGEL